eukprot:scaffold1931_cov390-Prasinococcus_capsulatus_cf.AAC.12
MCRANVPHKGPSRPPHTAATTASPVSFRAAAPRSRALVACSSPAQGAWAGTGASTPPAPVRPDARSGLSARPLRAPLSPGPPFARHRQRSRLTGARHGGGGRKSEDPDGPARGPSAGRFAGEPKDTKTHAHPPQSRGPAPARARRPFGALGRPGPPQRSQKAPEEGPKRAPAGTGGGIRGVVEGGPPRAPRPPSPPKAAEAPRGTKTQTDSARAPHRAPVSEADPPRRPGPAHTDLSFGEDARGLRPPRSAGSCGRPPACAKAAADPEPARRPLLGALNARTAPPLLACGKRGDLAGRGICPAGPPGRNALPPHATAPSHPITSHPVPACHASVGQPARPAARARGSSAARGPS